MRRLMVIPVLMALALTAGSTPALAKETVVAFVGPLTHYAPDVGSLFPASDTVVSVAVDDERQDKSLLAGVLVGPKADEGNGAYLAYAPVEESSLTAHMQQAAADALGILGLTEGEGGIGLKIVVERLHVDMYRLSGFSPMNCMVYATLRTVLTGAEGDNLKEATLNVALFDTTTPVSSMMEVSREAFSRLFARVAWWATATALKEHLGLVAEATEVERALGQLASMKEEIPQHMAIFWIGLAGHRSATVDQKLLSLFKSADKQKVYQAAVETVGMLGIEEARADIEAILSGKTKQGEWDMTDNEQVWYLLRALCLLGADEIGSKIPRAGIKMRNKLENLAAFYESGSFPEPDAVTQANLDKAMEKALKKARKKGIIED